MISGDEKDVADDLGDFDAEACDPGGEAAGVDEESESEEDDEDEGEGGLFRGLA